MCGVGCPNEVVIENMMLVNPCAGTSSVSHAPLGGVVAQAKRYDEVRCQNQREVVVVECMWKNLGCSGVVDIIVAHRKHSHRRPLPRQQIDPACMNMKSLSNQITHRRGCYCQRRMCGVLVVGVES
jgi:hypothetical protein